MQRKSNNQFTHRRPALPQAGKSHANGSSLDGFQDMANRSKATTGLATLQRLARGSATTKPGSEKTAVINSPHPFRSKVRNRHVHSKPRHNPSVQVSQGYPIQRSPNKDFTTKFAESRFQNADRSAQTIYAIYKKSDQLIHYVGKSNDDARRFAEHIHNKGLGDQFAYDLAASGSWTPFETATYEQYYIALCGGKAVLDNKINGLLKSKWEWFNNPKGEDQNKKQCTKLKEGDF